VKSGRNDVMVGGFKVSGNAVRQLPDRTIVHGTLLFSTDLDALENAIRPPVEKLERHGIQSVRQRVANLSDFLGPEWTVERLKSYLVQYFVTPR
jgi:lipoate-protein ligase A